MYINVILCDDDREFMLYMESLIEEIANNAEESYRVRFQEYYSGEELLAGISEEKGCDLIILDMQMSGMDGDEAALGFRKIFEDTVLLFCSGEVEPTTKSFRADAYRYLKKHGSQEDFMEDLTAGLNKALHNKRHSKVVIEDKQGMYELGLNDIMYVETVKRNCMIHLKGKNGEESETIEVNKSISEMKEILSSAQFADPHKSFWVNLAAVIGVRDLELELTDGTKIPVSKHKITEIKKEYARYIMRK